MHFQNVQKNFPNVFKKEKKRWDGINFGGIFENTSLLHFYFQVILDPKEYLHYCAS